MKECYYGTSHCYMGQSEAACLGVMHYKVGHAVKNPELYPQKESDSKLERGESAAH